jgi:hypothetical protein
VLVVVVTLGLAVGFIQGQGVVHIQALEEGCTLVQAEACILGLTVGFIQGRGVECTQALVAGFTQALEEDSIPALVVGFIAAKAAECILVVMTRHIPALFHRGKISSKNLRSRATVQKQH